MYFRKIPINPRIPYLEKASDIINCGILIITALNYVNINKQMKKF